MEQDKFGAALRILNQVPRWGILPRHKDNTVSRHSYWVAVYSLILADHLELHPSEKAYVARHALLHDIGEAVSGDIQGPYKRSAVDPVASQRYVVGSFRALGLDAFVRDLEPPTSFIKRIIKAADIIDDLMYLSEEIALGNRKVTALFDLCLTRMEKALSKIKCLDLYPDILRAALLVQQHQTIILQEDSDVGQTQANGSVAIEGRPPEGQPAQGANGGAEAVVSQAGVGPLSRQRLG